MQVTLQILRALIEKCARDLPIFSSYVLKILHDVLHSHHAGLLESSVPTFEAFCNHYDVAQFAADADHIKQYDEVVQRYASFASKHDAKATKVPLSANIAVRNRKAAIQAIKSLVSAEAFTADNGRQIGVIVPVILENMYSAMPDLLSRLKNREALNEERGKESATRPRPSTTASYTEEPKDADPLDASGTAEDADERANEEVGVLAMQTLRQVFGMDVPPHIRVATKCAIDLVLDRNDASGSLGRQDVHESDLQLWAIELFEDMARWTSVQTRFVILVTLTDALTKSPIAEEDLDKQLLLVRIIASLLRSDITFIGLSVNDVLIGFVNHILRLLQLGSDVKPHRQQTTSQGLLGVANDSERDRSQSTGRSPDTQRTNQASPLRVQLLDDLSRAIGDLATHIYYADQVGEMVSALLLRLKPPLNIVPSTTVAIENPASTAEAIAGSGCLQEDATTDGYFSFDTARLLALRAIKNIIEVANFRRKDGQGGGNRNRVSASTWNGTQWLLRDPCGRVRRAYVDALITWMFFELDKSSLRVLQEQHRRTRPQKHDLPVGNGHPVARPTLVNATKRSLPNLRAHSSFLELLTLAIYDNALQYVESEPDILLLHLLLVSLVQKLGVNSVRHGLPMIFRLQDDIPSLESLTAKDALGSLVHGYFWTLSEVFDFDTTAVGRDIANEISRRSQLGLWLGPVNVPALPIERIKSPTDTPPEPSPPSSSERTHTLHPLANRIDIVECINDSYSGSLLSPPSSPATSPRGRPMSSRSSQKPPVFVTPTDQQLPEDVKEQLLQPWTRERCIAEADSKLARSSSLTNSKAGSGSGRGGSSYLTANGVPSSGQTPETSRTRNVSEIDLNRPSSQGNLASRSPPDRPSLSAPASSSGRQSVRVSDLQRILETGQPTKFAYRFSQPVPTSDADSDSMVSADVSSIT